jgi:hypothetical protein
MNPHPKPACYSMVLLSIVQKKKKAKVSKKTPRHPADDCVGVVYDAKMF